MAAGGGRKQTSLRKLFTPPTFFYLDVTPFSVLSFHISYRLLRGLKDELMLRAVGMADDATSVHRCFPSDRAGVQHEPVWQLQFPSETPRPAACPSIRMKDAGKDWRSGGGAVWDSFDQSKVTEDGAIRLSVETLAHWFLNEVSLRLRLRFLRIQSFLF